MQYQDLRRDQAQYAIAVPAREQGLFVQMLFSYRVNPQTVLFLGYGETEAGSDAVGLTRQKRTFFSKIGYAIRP